MGELVVEPLRRLGGGAPVVLEPVIASSVEVLEVPPHLIFTSSY